MVDVEHGRLAALEEDGLAAVQRVVDDEGHVAHHRLHAVGEGQQVVGHLGGVERGDVHGLENGVLGGQSGLDLGAQLLRVEEVLNAQTDTVHLVGVGGADASTRRADEVVAARTLVRLVHEAVVRRDDVRVGGDAQARAVDAARGDFRELLEEHVQVDNDAVADDGGDAFGEDSGGQEVQRVLFAVNNDGVSGVVSSVEFHDEVGVLAELVSGLAFAFVAPLGAEHDDGGHEYLRLVGSVTRARATDLSYRRNDEAGAPAGRVSYRRRPGRRRRPTAWRT